MKKLKLLSFIFFITIFSCENKLIPEDMYYKNSVDKSNIIKVKELDSMSVMDIDSEGNIYFPERKDNLIKKITPDGKVSIFAGTGKKGDKIGKKEEAEFDSPVYLKIDDNGTFYIVLRNEKDESKIRTIDKNGIVSELKLDKEIEDYIPFLIGNEKVLIGKDFFSKDFKSILGKPDRYIGEQSTSLNKKNDFLYFLYEIRAFTENAFILKEQDSNNNIKTLYSYNENKFTNERKIENPENLIFTSPPTSITFDNEGNMYIGHRFGEISKFSSTKKYIKTYFTYEFTTELFQNKDHNNISSMLIDNKRKILYYTKSFGRDTYIYKINID